MKLKEIYIKVINLLKSANIENPSNESMILISYVLKIPKHKIITQPELEISADKVKEILNLVNKRLEGFPIAYIVKNKEFFGLDFYLEEGVLIPRPETEILVEKVLERIDNKNSIGLEVGVGSGCISVSLLKHNKNLFMYGIDISEKALSISKLNAEKHNVLNRFCLTNFDILKDNISYLNLPKLDFVVSNPPYIPLKDYKNLQKEVKKEPIEALIGGYEGTEFYEVIVDKFKYYLKENGFFAFEFGINQSEKIKEVLLKNDFKEIEIYKDLSGLDRILIGYKVK